MSSVSVGTFNPGQRSEQAEARIAVVLPCYNEAATIASVIDSFRKSLPDATIYVFDNNSSDATANIARRAGAIVRSETRQGKGHVVRRIFADVEADIYVMADGDGTYDATLAPTLIELMKRNHVDMVVGTRADVTKDAGRGGHAFGNKIFNRLFSAMFGRQFTDIFSGYRVFSRRFAKSFPAVSGGFEIETEMSVHSCQLGIPTLERPTPYGVRPEDSASKLRTFRDGFRILGMFFMLAKETRPAAFFGAIGMLLTLIALGLSMPLVLTYLETGLVPRLPTAILSVGLIMVATVTAVCGLILDSLARARVEAKRSVFLSYPAADWSK
ncbi:MULTISPECIES: glycosyltransferase [Henriciella]|jgi:glycosyltransferase involved in cell wall biosynthesis|uniref:Glycosyl transferase n=1 Tax=Henriciella pelagia TaxID=1977912 RepID=A0ABQ1JJA9_9PROT|nr:glycosyltransferase [Henriciella pelagia]GGB70405.1 glycosyl transferase [Henriciella pelagia]